MIMHRTVTTSDRMMNVVRWIARIGGSLLALSMLAFFLADVAAGHASLTGLATFEVAKAWVFVGLLVVQIVGIAVAWLWEGLGGAIVFGAALVAMIVGSVNGSFPANELLFGLVGLMFLVVWWQTVGRQQGRRQKRLLWRVV